MGDVRKNVLTSNFYESEIMTESTVLLFCRTHQQGLFLIDQIRTFLFGIR